MRTLQIAALAALVAAPVAAQTAAPTPFNGFFAGVQGGWQQDRLKLTVTNAGLTSSATESKSGLLYGGQVGYDFKLSPQIVLGGEASVTGRTGSDSFDDGLGGTYSLKAGRTFNASARLGYLVSPNGLVYARGGYSNARFNLDSSAGRFSEDRDGYLAGVGYEQYLSRNISARIEYDYSRYGSEDLTGLVSGVGSTSRLKYERHQVAAGVNVRF